MAAALAACGAESAGNAPASPLDAAPNPVSDAITDAAPSLQGDTKVDAPPGPPLHVLFIGNSYTSVNDLPATLRGIAESSKAPPSMVTEAVAVAGATLADHYLGADARPAIAKGGVTHVVLQGQSVEPLVQPAMFQKYAVLLANDATDAGATPTFYETWARRAGDAVYQASWSGGSPGAMQDGLLKANMQAASGSGAGNGVAWALGATGMLGAG